MIKILQNAVVAPVKVVLHANNYTDFVGKDIEDEEDDDADSFIVDFTGPGL